MSKHLDLNVDQLNEAISTIQRMKNTYRAFDRSEAAVLALSKLVGGVSELEKALVKRTEEVEEANKSANAAKVAALKQRESYDLAVAELKKSWAKEVEYQKDKAAKEISEITDRVARFRDESDQVLGDLSAQKDALLDEIDRLNEKREKAQKDLEAIKSRLG